MTPRAGLRDAWAAIATASRDCHLAAEYLRDIRCAVRQTAAPTAAQMVSAPSSPKIGKSTYGAVIEATIAPRRSTELNVPRRRCRDGTPSRRMEPDIAAR